MIIEVNLMPKDTSIDEATVAAWFVDEGEFVEQGEALVEMASEKETFEVRAPASGTIVELRADEDELLRVGDTLCLIETDEDEDYDEEEEEDEEEEDTDDADDDDEDYGG